MTLVSLALVSFCFAVQLYFHINVKTTASVFGVVFQGHAAIVFALVLSVVQG